MHGVPPLVSNSSPAADGTGHRPGETRPAFLDRWSGVPPVLDHLGIAVHSIAASRGFYELLGLTVDREETMAHEQVRTAMLTLGPTRVELLEPVSDGSVIGRFLGRRGEGLHHVALRTADLDGLHRYLGARGVRLASDRIRIGAGGHGYFFVHPSCSGGVLFEIVGERTRSLTGHGREAAPHRE